MSSQDDLDLRLRAWMMDAAPSRGPMGLVDRVADGTLRVRQRPAFLVRTGLRERRFTWPALAPEARLLLLLALALLVATIAAAAVGSRALLVNTVDPLPRLVYGLDGDIYVADEDGSDPVRIVDGDPDAECGGFWGNRGLVSPDGRHIAYRSECPGTVTIADLDGRVIASVPASGWDIAWAPDGARFATWMSLGTSIGVYSIDGTLQAELDGSVACCGDHDPRWTPDGTALLVPASSQVARLPLDGGEPEMLPAEDPLSIRSASFSPDGTRVAFTVRGPWPWEVSDGSVAGGAGAQLVIMATDGTEPSRVVELEPGEQVDATWGRGPLWSPSGDRIAIVADRHSAGANGDLTRESAQLRVVDPRSGSAISVAGAEDGGSLQPIAFSADGARILLRRFDPAWASDLLSVNADGSGSTIIVAGADHGEWVPAAVDPDHPASP